MSPRRRMWLRLGLCFVVAALVLCVVAGKSLWRQSGNNHFVHMADGWLDGRLALEDKPPGYCTPRLRAQGKCRGHAFDDWAVVWTLELADGRVVRGYPCRTQACRATDRRDRTQTWWVLGEGWQAFERGEIEAKQDTWYVSFPPGPALVFLPFVALFGLRVWDVALTVIAAALIPVVLVRLLDRERGLQEGRGVQHLLAAAAWTFASPALFLGAHGRVWFTAQIFGALFLTLYLSTAWNLRRPGWAGLWLGLAVACRPTMALAGIFFAWEWWRHRSQGVKPWIRFAIPVLVIGAALVSLNVARFGDPLEFGHRFLEIRWQARMQEVGMFSLDYLERNLRCLLTLLPTRPEGAVLPKVSLHGTALWLTTPWVLAFVLARRAFPQRAGLWLSALAVAIPPLLYQNSGQIQFTYRFAVDWLPLVLLALVFGGAVAKRWLFGALVVWGMVVQLYGAWYFGRAPGKLFVTDPLGWPFEDEL